jgi:sugar (pentulose or hexulose) kinase
MTLLAIDVGNTRIKVAVFEHNKQLDYFIFDSKEAWLMVNYQVLYSTLAAVTLSVGLLSWYLVRENKKVGHTSDFFIPLKSYFT